MSSVPPEPKALQLCRVMCNAVSDTVRHSTDANFRNECFSLMNVTNTSDFQNQFFLSLLKVSGQVVDESGTETQNCPKLPNEEESMEIDQNPAPSKPQNSGLWRIDASQCDWSSQESTRGRTEHMKMPESTVGQEEALVPAETSTLAQTPASASCTPLWSIDESDCIWSSENESETDQNTDCDVKKAKYE